MKTKILPLRRRVLAGAMIFAFTFRALANPTGLTVVTGAATTQTSGSQLSITTSQNAFLNWQSFNIGNNERTVFNQPNPYSVVVNQINGQSASQIYGSLQANGIIVLMNSSGFYFGPNSHVSAAGLVVSTANCAPPQNFGGTWEFNGPPPLASIVNYGSIRVGNGGSAFLIADKIENHGSIEAPGGSIGFAAGQTVTLSERPDGRGMSMAVTLPQGSVDNYGNVIADGGTIALNAKVVNQDGLVQANSVRNQNGVIELVASDALNLGANSQIAANGDNSSSGSAGGCVTLKSDNTFGDVAGSEISVAGGVNGGNGGQIEVSARQMTSLYSRMNAAAKAGWIGGSFLLDPPDYLVLDNGFISSFFGFNDITLQANYDITLADGTVWDLSGSTGQTTGSLKLQAGGNITIGDGALISDANNWSVSLAAGYDFINNAGTPGAGSIIFNGSGAIQTSAGGINLLAGQDITVGSGYVTTIGGGSISVHALTGSINTGSDAQGYHFDTSGESDSLSAAYNLGNGLGGISTAAGGNVTLIAGGNVTSYLPSAQDTGDALTAGAGSFGSQAGNVTVIAGGNVTGNYMVANGVGNIFAGVQMDANGNPVKNNSTGKYVLGTTGSAGTVSYSTDPSLALSLIAGGWNVTAAQNILLQEVRNPNGVFDVAAGPTVNHYFDYAPGDYVNLWAGNRVQLGAPAQILPRDGSDLLNVPVIYPSTLNITAGLGGIQLGVAQAANTLILFPSPLGSLTINTTGSMIGQLSPLAGAPQIFNLILSDSGSDQYRKSGDFGLNDHALTPVHLNSEEPVTISVSGDMDLVMLASPEAAQITVGGNMNNCRFQGMNLSAGDVTSINVTGDIYNRGAFTSVDLSSLSLLSGWQAPDLAYLGQALSSSPSATTLARSFYYNPVTKVLTYQNIPGQNLASLLQLLLHLPVQKVDQNGNLLWLDPPFDTTPATETVAVINSATAQLLLNQYNSLGTVPPNGSAYGFILGGGGQFNISAHNIDLGTSAGIQSMGAALYGVNSQYPLASLFGNGGVFTTGADIHIHTTGDLDMYSSSVSSLNGGNISINAGGAVNVGSSVITVTALGARGIFSTSGGDVSVIGGGDVNVNGSRIATYDGGNVTVESLNGNIDAGTGASSPVSVQGYYVGYYKDPVTHQTTMHHLYSNSPQLPFSGILAMTFPARDAGYPAPVATLGNILVEAPNGDVTANLSGILQIPLNNLNYPDALVTVLAGYELRDGIGNPVTAGNMTGATPALVSNGRDINAKGSGIIASNAKLDASGNINGLIFARNNIDIVAQQNVNVTALGEGNVSVGAGGSISGTLIGGQSVNAQGGSVNANEISANVSGSTSGQSGLGGGGTANNVATAASASDDATKVAKKSDDTGEDDLTKKKGKVAVLAQKVSRVTVILPPKKLSEKTTPSNPL